MDVEGSEFLDFVEVADRHELEYILTGGLALVSNGIVRFTQDADVWLRPDNTNQDKALLDFGYDEEDVSAMREADFTQVQFVRIHDVPLDVMTSAHQKFDYDTCRKREPLFTTTRGHKIYFLHINDLRELKVLARRPKDLSDVLMIDDLLEEQRKLNEESNKHSE